MAPRIAEPDLPVVFDQEELALRGTLHGAQIQNAAGDVNAAHSQLTECTWGDASLERLDLTGASLSDVVITNFRAVEVIARESHWRTVVVDQGRIGTLDLQRGEWDVVLLRGLRIDYLSLASATVSDLVIEDCDIRALDLPNARLRRVRIDSSRVDEVDTRELRAEDVDLRGLEALSFTSPAGLRGVTLSLRQAELHAASFATAMGIRVRD